MKQPLRIKNLHVACDNTPIVKGVSFDIGGGETHILMGPNGSGKSTFLSALAGLPHTKITKGKILIGSTDITELSCEQRAHRGMFLGFQNPPSISGVSLATLLRHAHVGTAHKQKIGLAAFAKNLKETSALLGLDEAFYSRPLNEGFSGGERKKSEILQLLMLKPRFAFLDEIDSGLDVDALHSCLEALKTLQANTKASYLLVTHNPSILSYVHPTRVHIMIDGRIVRSGGDQLIRAIEGRGFEQFVSRS